jgi:hypothetical protein
VLRWRAGEITDDAVLSDLETALRVPKIPSMGCDVQVLRTADDRRTGVSG